MIKNEKMSENKLFVSWIIIIRGPRTKTDWSRTGPGPAKFKNLGPARTMAKKILEIPDHRGPGPAKFRNLGPDQDQQTFQNL